MPRRASSLFLRVFFAFVCALAVAVACPRGGHALELTRPSRGSPVTVMSAVVATTTSAVYEWSAFMGGTVTVSSPGACTGTLAVQGSTTVNGTFLSFSSGLGERSLVLPNPVTGETSGTAYADVSLNFVRFVFTSTGCAGGLTVVVVPEPYTFRTTVEGVLPDGATHTRATAVFPLTVGGLEVGVATSRSVRVTPGGQLLVSTAGYVAAAILDTVVAVTNAAGGTTVVGGAGATVGVHTTTVQNLSATAIACSLGGVPVIGTTGTILAAGTGANTGDGGSATWNGYTGGVVCIAAGAGGSVAVQRW